MIKKIAIILLIIVALLFGGFQFLTYQTKKASPEQIEVYENDDLKLEVFYCSPSKKGRQIMDSLVPYGKIWRTGANEATTFSTNKTIQINGQKLAAGTYTLWTIPNKNQWEVIFNSKAYGWGVNWSQEALRESEFDVVSVSAPIQELTTTQEEFSITFEGDVNMVMAWENTKISVPITM